MYVKALRFKYQADGNQVHVDDDKFEILISNINTLYNAGTLERRMIIATLNALLIVAGMDSGALDRSRRHPNPAEFRFEMKNSTKILKPTYQRKRGATLALCENFATGTVDECHHRITACIKPTNTMSLQRVGEGIAPKFSSQEQAQNILKRDSGATRMVYCFSPACDMFEVKTNEGKFMQCPCRTTYYCSKECQVSASVPLLRLSRELFFSLTQMT